MWPLILFHLTMCSLWIEHILNWPLLSLTIWLSGLGVHLFSHLLHWMTTLLWSPEDKAHRWLAAEPKLTLMRKNIPLYPFKKIEAKSATTLLTQKIFTHPHAIQWRRAATTLKPLTVEVNNNALLGNLWSWLNVDVKLEQSPKQCCRLFGGLSAAPK